MERKRSKEYSVVFLVEDEKFKLRMCFPAQLFCGKKSVNLQLIATEGISTVLGLKNYR